MTLLESKNGIQYFTFEHSRDYQQVQFKFLDAVKSMDPNNIVVNQSLFVCTTLGLRVITSKYCRIGIRFSWHQQSCYHNHLYRIYVSPIWLQALLQLNPYHIDSLLQLSDVCRIQEDQEMARDLIGGLLLGLFVLFFSIKITWAPDQDCV